ncbi:hypothetical protein [Streptomyces sp. NPDC101393]|uniref:phage tail protein n=1 Tax=Streptomyces sp. NPDC101393 TaxID=3366141 RepID=UPI003817DBC6
MASPGGQEVGRLRIRVLPDTDGFAEGLQAFLDRIEARARLSIRVESDLDGFEANLSTRLAAISARSHIDVNVDVDRSAIDRLRQTADRDGRSIGSRLLRGILDALGAAGRAFTGAITGSLTQVQSAMSSNPYTAAIGLAIAAGIAATLLPALGAILSGLTVSVTGLGVIGLGAVLLKDEPKVKAAAKRMKKSIMTTMKGAAQPLIPEFTKAMGQIGALFKQLAPQFKSMFKSVAPAIDILGKGFGKSFKTIVNAIDQTLKKAKPIFEGLSGMVQKIADGISSFFLSVGSHPKEAGQALEDLGSVIGGTISFFGGFLAVLTEAYGWIRNFITGAIEWFGRLPETVRNMVDTANGWLISMYGKFSASVGAAIAAVVGWFQSLPGRVSAWVQNMVDTANGWLISMSGRFSAAVGSAITAILNWFSQLPGRVMSFISRMVVGVVGYIMTMGTRAAAGAGRMVRDVVAWIQGLPGRASSALSNLAGSVYSRVAAAGSRMLSAARSGVSNVVSAVRSLPGRARDALGNLGSYLYNSGASLLRGFINGIKSMIGSVKSAVSNAMSAARDFFPFSPAKTGPFSGRGWVLYSGRSVGEAFAQGIGDYEGLVGNATSSLAGIASGNLSATSVMTALPAAPPPLLDGARLVLSLDGEREMEAFVRSGARSEITNNLIRPANRGRAR